MAAEVDLTPFLFGEPGHYLAFDLIAGIKTKEMILAEHHLVDEELSRLLEHKLFQQRMREANAAWSSTANTRDRIAAKAAYQLEEAQLVLTEIVHDERAGAPVKLQAINTMAELAGIKTKGGVATGVATDTGPKFLVQFIFQNSQEPPLTIEAEAEEVVEEA